MIGKNKTRWLAFLLSVATVINLLPLTIGATNKVTAAESEPSDSSTTTDTITGTDNGDGTWTGSYLSYNEESGELEQQTTTATIVTGYGGTGHTLASGWYVALDRLTYADPLKISGDVHLILADGASVYTTDASCIDLTEGNSLTIYAQSKPKYKDDGSLDTEKTTTGRLYTGNSFELGISGIGTRNGSDSLICGTLTINGGIIEAASSGNAPGIGGGWSVGKITINGGYVDVKGNGAPAIGTLDGWVSGSDEYLTINGGTLIADSSTHSHYAHGIGSSSSPSFPVTINGFDFIRLSGSSSAFEEAPTINNDFYFRISVGDDLDHLTDLENSDVTSSIYTEYNAIEMIPCLTHVLLYECNDSETHTSTCKLCGKVEYKEPHEFDASSGLCACGLWKGEYLDFDSETMSYKKQTTTATVLTGDETVLNGYYVAIGEVEICSSTFEMNSSLIILADGAKLRIKGPDGSPTQIHVDAVSICAQSIPLYSKGGVVDENKNRAGAMIIDGCISGYGMDINGGIVSLGGSSAQIDVHHINMFGGLLDVAGNNPSGVIDASIGVYAPSCIKARNLNETKTAAIVGWVEIDESLKVCVTGDDGCVLPDELDSVFGSHSSVMIEPCTDETHTADTDQDTSDSHALTCKWCGSTFASHDFDKESGLCSCGLWHGIYLEYNHKTKKYDTKTATAKVLTGRETVLTEGWYVATGACNWKISKLSIYGDVRIILADNANLSIYTNLNSITQIVLEDAREDIISSHLCIYAQSEPVLDEDGNPDPERNSSGWLAIHGIIRGKNHATTTIEGGIVAIFLEPGQNAIALSGDLTINGGTIAINLQNLQAVDGLVTINNLKYLKVEGQPLSSLPLLSETVRFADGLYVRVTDDNGYVASKDVGSVITGNAKNIKIEPCTDATHKLGIKYKDANVHSEVCEWCGYAHDIAHVFDEDTGKCICNFWSGSYLEYNSETKSYDTKTTVATVITEDMTTLTEGWYVVIGEIYLYNSRLTIEGNVNIILADGSHYGAFDGIGINDSSHLHIYAQSKPVYNGIGSIDFDKDKSGVLTVWEYRGDNVYETAISSTSRSTDDGSLTIDGGYISIVSAVDSVLLNSVTINGGYLEWNSDECQSAVTAKSFTINGGCFILDVPYITYGINAPVTINGLDYIYIAAESCAFLQNVTITKGLYVRMQDNNSRETDEYLPFEDQSSLLYSGEYIIIEPCTHDLSITCKDSDTHNESCDWCGLDQDIAHSFDEKTGICECGVWGGSYLEYNSTTKSFETKTATATVITGNETKLTEGWYVVIGYIDSSITSMSGDVHIILADDSYLSTFSIEMDAGSNLRIYGQSTPIFDEYGDIDSNSKTGEISIAGDQEALKGGYNCTLTVDGGVAWINAVEKIAINIGSVTLNGGYLVVDGTSSSYTNTAIAANVTINGGRLFVNGSKYGINGSITINDFDHIKIMGNIQAITGVVYILEGLRVRIASVANDEDPTYIPFEDFKDYELSSDATWLTFEPCTSETHEMNENKTPICKDENVHTAICEWCGTTYDAVHEYDKDTGKCICGKDGISTSVIGYTLTLDGKIGVNFYMELSDEIASSATAYMHFILPDGSTLDIPVSDAKERIIDGKTYYVFSCYVAAYEMTSDIYAQIKEGELSGTLYDFTIREYAEYIINNPSDYTEGDVAFAKSLLNYGAAAQTYFEVEADDLANKNLDDTDKAITELTAEDLVSFAKEPISKEGVGTFVGFNLALGSETSLRAYFDLWDGVNIGDVVFTVNGVIVKTERAGDYYRIAADNIKAFDLDEDITFTATVGDEVLTFECSAMSYCHSVLIKETSDNYPATLKTLLSAMRAYQLASEIYK